MSQRPRLSDATWDATWNGARYDRRRVRSGVVHLGLGAFHRAHQAPVFDALIEAGDARWGVVGVAMRSPRLAAALADQDGLYSLSIRSGDGAPPQVIGAIKTCLVAAQAGEAVVSALSDPDVHLATLTVTEKGYLDHGPASPAGLIAAALERRRTAGLAPLTVLSCDNRAGNGPFARDAVLAAADAAGLGDAALDWIGTRAAFPSSMVDRITPATTPEMIELTSVALGLQDEAAVWTEPFWQWVVEDRFAGARPDLASGGVQVVADVAPWEAAKLRLLNAAHSTLAYLGLLRGRRFVHEAIADPELERLVGRLWREASATVDREVVGVDAYCAALTRRFSNPALPHALIQIAADGSQKAPPRLLSTLAERASRGLASPALSLAVAGWAQALATLDGLADPLIERLASTARTSAPSEAVMSRLLEEIDPKSAAVSGVIDETARALTWLREHGVDGALAAAAA